MALTTQTRTIGNVLASTTDARWIDRSQDGLISQVLNGIPLLKHMAEKPEERGGGSQIRFPLEWTESANVISYEHWDPLKMNPEDFLTEGYANWKSVLVTLMLSGEQLDCNDGDEAVFNLWEAQFKWALRCLRNGINKMLWADGTGNDSKDLLGLQAIIHATPSSSGSIYGINRTNESWFRNKQKTSGSFAAQGVDDMRDLWTTVGMAVDEGEPDLIISNSDVYNFYEAKIQPLERFVRESVVKKTTGDLGFTGLTWKGAKMIWDPAAPTGKMYFLNTRYLKLVALKNRFFKPSERKTLEEHDGYAQHIVFRGELVCTAPRFQGVMTAITA